jgi:hypothetical protein
MELHFEIFLPNSLHLKRKLHTILSNRLFSINISRNVRETLFLFLFEKVIFGIAEKNIAYSLYQTIV